MAHSVSQVVGPELAGSIFQIPAPFKYDPCSDLGFHFTSGGFSDQWTKVLPENDSSFNFDMVDAGKAQFAQWLRDFAKRYDLKFLSWVIEVLVDGNIELLKADDDLPDAPPAKNEQSRPRKTKKNMSSSLETFEDWGIVERVSDHKSPHSWSSAVLEGYGFDEQSHQALFQAWCILFPVLKKNGKHRAIFDSRDAGKLCKRPGPINLAELSDVIRAIVEADFYWTGDLKHWFYQIPIHRKLKDLFLVQAEGRDQPFYRMSVLPMGWSWSPRMAQCLAWGIILFHTAQANPHFDMAPLKGLADPPSSLTMVDKDGVPCGKAFLWIDNILLVGRHDEVKSTATSIVTHALEMNVWFSEPEGCDDPKKKVPPEVFLPSRQVEYLGMRFSKNPENSQVSWTHTSKKYRKLEALLESLKDIADSAAAQSTEPKISPRLAQCVVGNAIWDSMVSLRPLWELHDLIDVARCLTGVTDSNSIQTNKHRKVDWDKEVCVDTSDLSLLIKAVTRILSSETSPYCATHSGKEEGVLFLCTDASDSKGCGIAYLHTSRAKARKECWAEQIGFPTKDDPDLPFEYSETWDIAVLELWVAVKAIIRHRDSDKQLVLGIDSAVARAWLRRRMAGGEQADLVRQILANLPPCVAYRTVFLYSEDNLADLPSRRVSIMSREGRERYERSWKILSGSHVYLRSLEDALVAAEGLPARNAMISVEDLAQLDMDRVKRSWARWTHHPVVVSQVQYDQPSDACDLEPSEGPVERTKRGRPDEE